MFILGLADDLVAIGAWRKLIGQVVIASGVYFAGVTIAEFRNPVDGSTVIFGYWGLPITVCWLVAITNLINLIDGADGLAAGISLMLMLLLAYVAFQLQGLTLIAVGMAGALLGFLCFNFPPARIYLGDGGAYFLGFLIGMLSLVSSQKGTVAAALIAPLFVLALPIADTLLAVLRRGLRGLPIFRPDRKHIHHKLARSGYSQRKVVLSLYVLTAIFLLLALGVFWSQGRLLPILLGALFVILLSCAGAMDFSRQWFAVGRVLGSSLEMRQEIQYALALSRWLELQSLRSESVQELWADFLFMVRKLGFASARLTLAAGEHYWENEAMNSGAGEFFSITHELRGSPAGHLELRARKCPSGGRSAEDECALSKRRRPACPCVSDQTLFDILSELSAEAWLKASQQWHRCHGTSVAPCAENGGISGPRMNKPVRSGVFRFLRAGKA